MLEPTVVTLPAGATAANEDAVAIGPGVVVVVDGAGLPADLRRGCAHSVAWYAAALASSFRDHLVDGDADMRASLADAIRDVANSHGPGCQLDLGSPSATVAAWRVDDDTVDSLVLGDASLIFVSIDSSVTEVCDDRLARVTEPLITRNLQGLRRDGLEPTADDIRQARRAAVEQTRNTPGGFWCCHADPAAASAAVVTRRPRHELVSVIAASDGATRGYQLLDFHGLVDLARMATDGRAIDALAEVRAAESDSTALSSQGMKVHDDATLVTQLLTDAERLRR